MSSEFEIDDAVFGYAKSYAKLWKQIRDNPSEFPSNAISCGSIAEHYAKKYLEFIHEGATVRFGTANEKAWDIEVVTVDKQTYKYQVKSVSLFNRSRTTTQLVKGFDRLIVLSLDCDFFPYRAYLFEDAVAFWASNKIKKLKIPDPSSRRRTGTAIFQSAKDIKDEFFDALALEQCD